MENETINMRVLIAELIGTAVLVMGGPGSAILAGQYIGIYGVAVAFGLSLAIMAYVIGPISGCHINPAVTLGFFLKKRIDQAHAEITHKRELLDQLGELAALIGRVRLLVANDTGAVETFIAATGEDPGSREARCRSFRQLVDVLQDFELHERAAATRYLMLEGLTRYGREL